MKILNKVKNLYNRFFNKDQYKIDKKRAYMKAYKLKNKEKLKIKGKIYDTRYREEHKEAIAERKAGWTKAQGEKYLEKERARNIEFYNANKYIFIAKMRLRKIRKKQQTPAWADLSAIENFYREAERITLATGIMHHVDHIIPLYNKHGVRGLHLETNLQVLTAKENWAKSVKYKSNNPDYYLARNIRMRARRGE